MLGEVDALPAGATRAHTKYESSPIEHIFALQIDDNLSSGIVVSFAGKISFCSMNEGVKSFDWSREA